jgi:hypothetical protein
MRCLLTVIDISSKLRLTEREVKSLGPEFEKDWGESIRLLSSSSNIRRT